MIRTQKRRSCAWRRWRERDSEAVERKIFHDGEGPEIHGDLGRDGAQADMGAVFECFILNI